jgi:hypothetical protein
MILERQVELLILNQMLEAVPEDAVNDGKIRLSNDKIVDCNKMNDRVNELIDEFIEPYVIDNALRGD